jgi:hypothetical protein
LLGRAICYGDVSTRFPDGRHYVFDPGAFADSAMRDFVDIRDGHGGKMFAGTAGGTLIVAHDRMGVYFEVRDKPRLIDAPEIPFVAVSARDETNRHRAAFTAAHPVEHQA